MRKLLIISGPTATGKTSLGFRLAKKFDGEIISADSRQIYRGMDVVTGKELDKEIKTWIVDVVEPDQEFSVADYYEQVWIVIDNIWRQEKLPIVVGGTGFYIKAVLDGIGTMGVAPDWELRRQLEQLTVEELQQRLQEVDSKRWKTMNESDRRNPRRLIRAIEVSIHPGGVHSATPGVVLRPRLTPGVNVLWIGLRAPFDVLYQRIDQRVDERIKMGAVEEARRLAETYSWDIPSMTGQGYQELRGFIEGNVSLEETIKRWKFAEHEYARRQMTWFKKDKRIVWFDIREKDFQEKVEKMVEQWYISK